MILGVEMTADDDARRAAIAGTGRRHRIFVIAALLGWQASFEVAEDNAVARVGNGPPFLMSPRVVRDSFGKLASAT